MSARYSEALSPCTYLYVLAGKCIHAELNVRKFTKLKLNLSLSISQCQYIECCLFLKLVLAIPLIHVLPQNHLYCSVHDSWLTNSSSSAINPPGLQPYKSYHFLVGLIQEDGFVMALFYPLALLLLGILSLSRKNSLTIFTYTQAAAFLYTYFVF